MLWPLDTSRRQWLREDLTSISHLAVRVWMWVYVLENIAFLVFECSCFMHISVIDVCAECWYQYMYISTLNSSGRKHTFVCFVFFFQFPQHILCTVREKIESEILSQLEQLHRSAGFAWCTCVLNRIPPHRKLKAWRPQPIPWSK